MKNLKKSIIVILIIIILIIILLAILLMNKKNKNPEATNENVLSKNNESAKIEPNYANESFEQQEVLDRVESVTDINEYFTVKALVNNYIINVKNKNADVLKSIIAEEYINNYNINEDNMFTKISYPETTNKDQYYNIIITNILRINLGNERYLYIAKEKCRIVNKGQYFDTTIMLELDYKNNIYCVYPQQYVINTGFDKIKKDDNIRNPINEEIKNNGNNKFTEQHKSNQDLIKEYFNTYKELLIYYPDEAYSKLNQEYLVKRFRNKDDFNKYLKENKTINGRITLSGYKLKLDSGYRDYICTDQFNNEYIFRVVNGDICNYEVFLDDYTIMPNYEKEEYNSLTEYQKAKENVKIFENMLNNKNYSAIYNVLDNAFRENNYKSVESLKSYLANNVYMINHIDITDFDMDDSDYYVYECELQNEENSNEKKNMTIIIKLGEDTDFTMSFSFN